VADPRRLVVHDTEHFVGYVSPIYPWGVILTTRRHACDGPWALSDEEAVDLGRLIPRIAGAVRQTGGERAYVLAFGEETPVPHFHVAILSRHLAMSEAERRVLYGRVTSATSDPLEDATGLAADLRAILDEAGVASVAGGPTSAVAGCMICEQVFDPDRKVVYDTEHFVGYVTPKYPWAVILTSRRHECEGPWALDDAEAVDLGRMIPRVSAAIRSTGSERVYFSLFGEEGSVLHFHLGLLCRYVPLAEAEHDVMYERVQTATSEPSSASGGAAPSGGSKRPSMRARSEDGSALAQVAADFALAVRGHLR
jgi:diadenosine tetraphosphate (Ap4A) HIT family hydrolase